MQDNCSRSSHEKTEDKCKEYDDLFPTLVSPLGRYQKTVFFTSSALVMLTSCQFAALLFVYGTPNFHCQSDNSSSVSSCPPNKCCENCTSYVFDGPFRSIVSEWHLICDKAYVGANLQACFFVGMLVGGCVAGMVSDFFGRKKCTYIFASILITSAFASVFADCLSLLGVLRFLMGFGAFGNQMGHFTFMLELLGPKYRTLVSGVFQGYFLLGYFMTCFVAYFIRDWRSVVLLTSLPGLLLFGCIRIYPESPRWLLSQNRLEEAHKTLDKCRDNSTKTQPGALKRALEEIKNAQFATKNLEEEKVYTLLDLVRTPKLRRRSIITAFNWFAVSFISNSLFLYIDDLSGNIYLNFAILNCLSPMSVIASTICTKRIGRRVTHSGILLIAGLLCLVSLAVPTDHSLIKTWIFVVGTAIVSGLWVTIYLISTELFPTVLRSTAIGTGYTLGRVGGILAPYVGMVGQLPGLSVTLPLIILGVVSLATAICAMLLPETLNSTMHQTIEEEESAREDYSLVCCQKPIPNDNDVIANMGSSEADHPERITSVL